jgi:hypothetical protein
MEAIIASPIVTWRIGEPSITFVANENLLDAIGLFVSDFVHENNEIKVSGMNCIELLYKVMNNKNVNVEPSADLTCMYNTIFQSRLTVPSCL